MTGGQGFIGRALISRLLTRGHSVTAGIRSLDDQNLVQDSRLTTVEFNEDTDFLYLGSQDNFDCIVHLATRYSLDESLQSVNEMIKSNYNLILNLLLGAAAKSTPLVLAGSFTQNSSANGGPVSVYSLTKDAASQASTYFANEHRMKILELRIFDTYGVGDNRRKFLDLLVDAALSGEQLNASSGEQMIDLVNIVDVIDGLENSLTLLQKFIPGEHRIFEIASRNPKSLRELASLVETATKKNINVKWGFYPYRRFEMFNYLTKYPLLPNWHSRIDLMSGIQELVESRGLKFNE